LVNPKLKNSFSVLRDKKNLFKQEVPLTPKTPLLYITGQALLPIPPFPHPVGQANLQKSPFLHPVGSAHP
jgi:hypothetical protein